MPFYQPFLVPPGVSALQFKSLFSHSMDVEWSTLDWESGGRALILVLPQPAV